MLIYKETVKDFNRDVFNGIIAAKLEELFERYHIGKESRGEYRAWNNSLEVMSNLLLNAGVDGDLGVAIEYQIPLTSKRVDFLMSGLDSDGHESVVAVELKQWDDAEVTSLENCVKTYVGGGKQVLQHPSQQILNYCRMISNFNATVQDENISLVPCAFLHNYPRARRFVLEDKRYEGVVSCAPLFFKEEKADLGEFFKKNLVKPATRNLFEKIDGGKLRPSKALQDSILGMLEGKEEFALIDEQQVAYATISKLAKQSVRSGEKHTIIVVGGPGTGKSVIAMQTMAKLISQGYAASYMTKNAAPRDVFKIKLVEGHKKESFIRGVLQSPISLEHNIRENAFPCILVDEGHRLTTRYGHNQIEDIIRSSQVNVFFIDEDQKVTTKDIGSIEAIKAAAQKYGSRIIMDESLHLKSQFRCNGSDAYLAFLDNVLGIRETENKSLDGLDYEIRVYRDACKMREDLRALNQINNKARLVAGYCYEWVSQNSPTAIDIRLPGGFEAQWNLRNGEPFAISDTSFEQVGCIHTCQGLEFDYVGVIIGKDLRYEKGHVITDQTQIAQSDKSSGIRGCKDRVLADRLIRNTYKTLMSRGQQGCFVYCEDNALADYLENAISLLKTDDSSTK